MRIGVDFDNTLACYDGVFHRAALERGLIPQDLPAGKNDVRDYLNGSGRGEEFTELQGYVYGARMDLAALYPGVLDFLEAAREQEHALFVVSHKTRRPLRGAPYDLHAAARAFLEGQCGRYLAPDSVFFEETKELKIARIAALDLDVFIDDLPEILTMPGFPTRTAPILFDPDGRFAEGVATAPRVTRHGSWSALAAALLTHPAPRQ
ncbi:hypothetical protein [Methylocystis bryophila]|uniref:Haloacid dehalogenase-like hydrolase n=1 Tax=Methylocystis bryophila TaxID=655015 RepID=A0A1W6N065_9HYPH|nr:hypothetical protein [Methylocystis bryophila]ARN83220.1 hypothetical protein B1812_21450 [Methylocystis bryophila]